MCRRGGGPEPSGAGDGAAVGAAFTALLEDSAEELYESAPCGYLSTLMDGTVAKANATLLNWLGLEREAVVGRKYFADLLTVGGKLYHETHFAPLLRMQGELHGIALEMKTAHGGRLPVLVSSVIKHGSEGEPLLIRTTVFDASDRRAYEEELLRRRQDAERARAEAERACAEAERARTEAERARAEAEQARRQAGTDRERLADALAVLQKSLLPDSLPALPGLETAVYYHTASPDQLGGDFYDLSPIDGDRWAFFLGDVCGKGPRAAALTSLTRYTLRAAAHHDPEPDAALTTLNAVLHERYTAGGDPRYCTCVFGVLEPGTDGRTTVRLGSGGHPPGAPPAGRRPGRVPAHPGGPAGRRPARRSLRDRHDRPGPRRDPPALHRRPHRGPHRPDPRQPVRRRGSARLRRRPRPRRAPRGDHRADRTAGRFRQRPQRRHRPARPRRPRRPGNE